MGVPDNIWFGEAPEGGAVNYGFVRSITDDDTKIEYLKGRLDSLLFYQVQRIAKKEDGSRNVFTPFPLAVLANLCLETLGRVILPIKERGEEYNIGNNRTIDSDVVLLPVYRLMDERLVKSTSKKFRKAHNSIHDRKSSEHDPRYFKLIIKYLRNSLNHDFQAKGVFLGETKMGFVDIFEAEGYLVLDSYKFWDRFEEVYHEVFQVILSGENKQWRESALYAFKLLIK